jgi:hypothetical protein
LAEDHELVDDDLQHDSNNNEDYDRDDGGAGKTIKKKG